MLRTRIIPVLLLRGNSLVKTVKFSKYNYIGDPVNTCRIFNELEVDELSFLDISATIEKREPNLEILKEISNECFMPLSYGGGIDSLNKAEEIFKIGFEKVILNTAPFSNSLLINEISKIYGSQAVVVAIDIKKSLWGKYEVYSTHGTINRKLDPIEWAQKAEQMGAGEILLTNIDNEGSWKGFDIDIIKKVTDAVSIPVIAHGGASKIDDIVKAVKIANASAVALGSMVVYQQKGMGVLVNFPDKRIIKELLQ